MLLWHHCECVGLDAACVKTASCECGENKIIV